MEKKTFIFRQIPLAIATGILLFLASPGIGIPPVTAFFGLLPLLFALKKTKNTRRALLLGLIAGLAWYMPLLHWITIVLGTYGYMPLSLTLLVLFSAGLLHELLHRPFCRHYLSVATKNRRSSLFRAPALGRPRLSAFLSLHRFSLAGSGLQPVSEHLAYPDCRSRRPSCRNLASCSV